jgi:hypothetical protein
MPDAIEITLKGPIFTGEASAAAHECTRMIVDRVAAYALQEVQRNLDGSIKHPTPYYETQITIDRRVDDRVVTDRGVIYGPWLEGTGSRNRTTRFKGYASFRRARQTTERAVRHIAGGVVSQYLQRMRG